MSGENEANPFLIDLMQILHKEVVSKIGRNFETPQAAAAAAVELRQFHFRLLQNCPTR